jgi:hypothetical protein
VALSGGFPVTSRNACLPQNTREQVAANVAGVWVGNSDSAIATDHELVLATSIRPVETQLEQCPDELSAADWAEGWHP